MLEWKQQQQQKIGFCCKNNSSKHTYKFEATFAGCSIFKSVHNFTIIYRVLGFFLLLAKPLMQNICTMNNVHLCVRVFYLWTMIVLVLHFTRFEHSDYWVYHTTQWGRGFIYYQYIQGRIQGGGGYGPSSPLWP